MQLDLIVGSTTYSLTDGNPYSLESATGLAMPPVRRFSRSYPGQDGHDDLGHVLEPRTITLSLLFDAVSHTQLDERRSTLARMFAPGTNLPLVLEVTRDDGEKRRLDVTASGLSTIELDLAHRPGRLHKAQVTLRAAEPVWYGATPGTVTFGTAVATTWYLASNLIPQSAVLDARLNPGTADVVNTGIIRPNGMTYMFRGVLNSSESVGATMWQREYLGDIHGYGKAVTHGTALALESLEEFSYGAKSQVFVSEMDDGTHTVIVSVQYNTPDHYGYIDGSRVFESTPWSFYRSETDSIRWRHDHEGNVWAGSVSHVAAYSISLTEEQAVALTNAIDNIFSNVSFIQEIGNSGDYHDFPVISLTGPLADVVVRQVETNKRLDFTGSTIPAGVVYTIDLRRDALSVVDSGGTIRTSELTDTSDLGEWALPAGTGNISVTSTVGDSNSRVQVVYRTRHVSY